MGKSYEFNCFSSSRTTVALLFAAYFTYTIFKVDEGTDSMKHIAESIRKGANAYLKGSILL